MVEHHEWAAGKQRAHSTTPTHSRRAAPPPYRPDANYLAEVPAVPACHATGLGTRSRSLLSRRYAGLAQTVSRAPCTPSTGTSPGSLYPHVRVSLPSCPPVTCCLYAARSPAPNSTQFQCPPPLAALSGLCLHCPAPLTKVMPRCKCTS